MIRRLDSLWSGLLGKAHRWILRRVAAHCRREMVRGAEAHCSYEAQRRLERHLWSQKPRLN